MEQERSNKVLDRGVAADLWRRTLSQITTVFGRLVYLASLRNVNTGRYEHHGLALVFGEDEAHRALRKSHVQIFEQWLNFSIKEQHDDLTLYLLSLEVDKRILIENWLRDMPYKDVVPPSFRAAERRLHIADITALLELLKNELGVSLPDPDA